MVECEHINVTILKNSEFCKITECLNCGHKNIIHKKKCDIDVDKDIIAI